MLGTYQASLLLLTVYLSVWVFVVAYVSVSGNAGAIHYQKQGSKHAVALNYQLATKHAAALKERSAPAAGSAADAQPLQPQQSGNQLKDAIQMLESLTGEGDIPDGLRKDTRLSSARLLGGPRPKALLDLTRALQELYTLSQTKMQVILGSSKFDLNWFCMHLSQARNFASTCQFTCS